MFKGFLSGRVVNDARVFTYNTNNGTQSGVSFSVASNGNSGRDDDVTYVNCTYFNRDENFAQYVKQGNQVIVSGPITTNRNESTGATYINMIVEEFEFGAKKQ